MTKYRTLGPGDGITGPTGLEYRNLTNDMIPGDAYFVPEDFVWTVSLAAYANTVMVITYDHTVNGTITLPANCTLKFKGGRILGTTTIVGNGSKIINHDNLQCLNLNTTISGTWVSTKACVEWWGAVSNPDITTYDNDVMPYVGKLAVSGFEAFCLGGFYYVGSTLKILQPFDYRLLDNIQPYGVRKLNDTGSWIDVTNPTPSKQTTFYSNLDINWFEVESPYVNIIGGIFDISAVSFITKYCIYINNNETVDHCTFKQVCRGNPATVILEGQTGGYFRWEALAPPDQTVAGHLYKVDINVECLNIPYGVNIDAPDPAPTPYDWANGINVTGRFTGCKVGLRHMSASWAKIKAVFQSGVCHAESERGLYQFYVSGYPAICDVFCWDLYGTESGTYPGYYYPALPVYVHSYGLQLEGASLVAYRLNQFRGVKPMGYGVVNDETRIKIFKDGWNGYTFISDIHSALLFFNKKTGNTASIIAYQGTGFDFDDLANRLPASAEPSANISIQYAENLLSNKGFPTTYTFEVGTTDYDNDFVEIVLSGSGLRLNNLFLYLMGYAEVVKRIQVIPLDEDDNLILSPGVLNQYPVSGHYTERQYYDFELKKALVKTLIIRLIGTATKDVGGVDTPAEVRILDIAGLSGGVNLNFIDKHDLPMTTFHALLNQSGTDAPTMAIRLNTMSDTYTPSCSYQGVGSYRLNYSYQFPANKMLPVSLTLYTDLGKIVITRATDSYYTIQTYDTNDSPANGILVNQPIILNRYW